MLAALAAGARAQDLPPAVVAVLDFQAVMRDAAAAQDIRRQLQGYRERYQQEIARQEAELRRQEQDLKQQQALLTPEAFDQRRQTFEKQVIEIQRQVEDRRRALQRSADAAMAEIQKVIVPIVKDLTVEQGFNLVVDSSQMLFAKKSLNITPLVIERLNQRLPAVQVQLPAQ